MSGHTCVRAVQPCVLDTMGDFLEARIFTRPLTNNPEYVRPLNDSMGVQGNPNATSTQRQADPEGLTSSTREFIHIETYLVAR